MPAQPATPTSPAHHHCTILVIGFMTNAAVDALADIQREYDLMSTTISACMLSSDMHPLMCKASCCMFSCNQCLPGLCLQSGAEQASSFDHVSSYERLNNTDKKRRAVAGRATHQQSAFNLCCRFRRSTHTAATHRLGTS